MNQSKREHPVSPGASTEPAAIVSDDCALMLIEPATADAEIVPPGEVLAVDMPEDVEAVEKLLASAPGLSDAEIIAGIADCSTRVDHLARDAASLGSRALMYAWACGALLNSVKSQRKHGAFKKWQLQHLDQDRLGARTAQRYMRIASYWSDIHLLLKESSSLTEAYALSNSASSKPPLAKKPAGNQAPDHCPPMSPSKDLLIRLMALQSEFREFRDAGGRFEMQQQKHLSLLIYNLGVFSQDGREPSP